MTYSVGIIGTGFGSKVHLPGFQQHDKFDVDIIAGRDEEKTKNIATAAGIEYTTHWQDIMDLDVDLVAVTTPPFLHYEMGLATIDAGKHLLLEKPTTHNALQAKELASKALNQGLIGMMNHEFRWLPHRAFLTDLIHRGKIGKISEIHYHTFYQFAASKDWPRFGWLWDERFEGGILRSMGSHMVDQVRATTKKEFTELSGYITTRIKERADGSDSYAKVTADDGFGFHFKMEDDIIGNLTVSTSIKPVPVAQFILAGDKGVMKLQDNVLYYAKTGEDQFPEEPLTIPDEFKLDTSFEHEDGRLPPYLKLLDVFYEGLESGETPSPSLTDGWRNQQVLDAVRLSHKTGNQVHLE